MAERDGLPRKQMSADALERLQAHHWPGNVRELENLIRRVAALHVDEVITGPMIERELADSPRAPEQGGGNPGQTLDEFLEAHFARYFAGFGDGLPPVGLYDRVLASVEPPLIHAALAATKGNQIKAAELLGLNRNTLRSKIRMRDLKVIRGG